MIKAKETVLRGNPAWCVDLRSINQGRKFFTGKTARMDAKAFAASRQELSENYGGLAKGWPHQKILRWAAVEERLRESGISIEEAADLALKFGNVMRPIHLSVACETVMETKRKANSRDTYLRSLHYHWGAFRRKFGDDRELHTISHGEINEWLNENDWAAATRRGIQINISTLYECGVKEGWASHNPVKKLERPFVDDKPVEIFTIEECVRLMASVIIHKPELTTHFALRLFGGIRTCEVRKLSRREVLPQSILIPAHVAKGGTRRQRRLVVINDTLAAWMAVEPDKQVWGEPFRFQNTMEGIVEKSGIEHWKQDGLRHSFCSYALPVFGVSRTTSDAGHTESMLFKHYREIVTPADATAFWKILP